MEFLGLTKTDKDFTNKEFTVAYVDEFGGKIDTISVDNVQQEIVNKNVNIDLSGKADVDKAVNNSYQDGTFVSSIKNDTDGIKLQSTKSGNTSAIQLGASGAAIIEGSAQLCADKSSKEFHYLSPTGQTKMSTASEIAVKGDVDAINYEIKKLETAETGYLSTYQLIDKDGNVKGASINIAKDLVVNKAELKTCSEKNVPETGYQVGDKYIDLTINTISGSTHVYLNVKELVDVYTGDTAIKIDSDRKVSLALKTANGLKINDKKELELGLADSTNNGAMSATDFDKLTKIEAGAQVNTIESVDTVNFKLDEKQLKVVDDKQFMTAEQAKKLTGIADNATKVSASGTNGSIQINNAETKVYTHPTTTATEAKAVKVGKDGLGHTVIGTELTLADLAGDSTHNVVTDAEKETWNNLGKLQTAISVTNAVGEYSVGDTIAAGTSLETIIKKMLTTTA